jgi:hypothetical protein
MTAVRWCMMAALAAMALSGGVAMAQSDDVSDQELLSKQLLALKAENDLLQALMKRREAQWTQYSQPLWQPPKAEAQRDDKR